nr:restriction endonuclease [Pyrinomonadaceae bacterium]
HVQFQVKRWRHSVGSVEINHFRGALNTTAKGVFITTGYFTKAAVREAEHPAKPCISLIDGYLFSKIVREVSLDLNDYK